MIKKDKLKLALILVVLGLLTVFCADFSGGDPTKTRSQPHCLSSAASPGDESLQGRFRGCYNGLFPGS